MKVLFIAPASSIHTVRWVNALAEKGLEVILVSLKNHEEKVDQISQAVKIKYLSIIGTKGYYLNAFTLKKIYNEEKPDIVNTHYASGYGTLARVAKIPNVILSLWGSDVYEFPYQSILKMRIIKKNICWAKQIASTSYAMSIQAQSLVDKRLEIAVTPFGVDCDRFLRKCRKNSDTFSVCTIKALLPNYKIDILIEAFSIFMQGIEEEKNKLNIKLNIYGKGELLQQLKQQVEILNLSRFVIFHGYVKNSAVPTILNQTDVFCCCSQMESFGVSAVEAMACEVPVIATDADGFKEVIEDGKTGFIVKKNSPAQMAEYMMLLYKNETLRRQIGEEGRRRVEKLYNWENNVKTMIALYNQNRREN